MTDRLQIARIETFAMRANATKLPKSSLGAMSSRNGLLVRVEDVDGAHGWGEVWCNFPPSGHIHRASVIEEVFAHQIIGQTFSSPREMRTTLENAGARMAVHVGEPGTFAHCLAGLDMAVTDLSARRQGVSLTQYLTGTPANESVSVYASTPSANDIVEQCTNLVEDGHLALKIKVGYTNGGDIDHVSEIRSTIGDAPRLMIDANQAWSLEQAKSILHDLADADIFFVEEPLSALAPMDEWCELARNSSIRLAAGENIYGVDNYRAFMDNGALQVYQPDVAKWGGISGCYSVARSAKEHGYMYCPHFMGTAVGLAASLHLLAASGGDGMAELDTNDNHLRTDLLDIDLGVTSGRVAVPQGIGIGVEPELADIKKFIVT